MSSFDYKDQEGLSTLTSETFSEWSQPLLITQEMINEYAEISGDHMWMHVDVERCAKESPYGTTIAHGFLILSVLPKLPGTGPSITDQVTGWGHMMNYGSDKLRFLNAVTVGSEIHSKSRIKAIEVAEHKTKVVMEQHVHAVGQDKPALIYELVFVFL